MLGPIRPPEAVSEKPGMARTIDRLPRRVQRAGRAVEDRLNDLDDDVDDIVDEMASLRSLFWKVVGGVGVAVLSFLTQVAAVLLTRGK